MKIQFRKSVIDDTVIHEETVKEETIKMYYENLKKRKKWFTENVGNFISYEDWKRSFETHAVNIKSWKDFHFIYDEFEADKKREKYPNHLRTNTKVVVKVMTEEEDFKDGEGEVEVPHERRCMVFCSIIIRWYKIIYFFS